MSTDDAGNTDRRRQTEAFWADLYRRDFDAVGARFHPHGTYTDVPTPAEDLATGPAEIAARLRLGLEPLQRIEHGRSRIFVDGDVAITEHVEIWHWDDDHSVANPFVSIHEYEGDKIVTWLDYWDLQTLLGAAPQWWLDHIMSGGAGAGG